MAIAEQLTDEQVIEHIRSSGSREGFAILYRRYAHIMLGWCLRYLKDSEASQDAVMDIMQQLLENLNNYEIKNFKNWLFLVTRNHCFMKLRGKTTVLIEDVNRIDSTDFVESTLEEHLNNERTENALHEAIEDLSPGQKECIVLFYFKKKSYKDIEEITGYELKKVKSYIQNGKRNLRISLEEVLDQE